MTDQERQAVVAEAKTWIGTPYRGWAQIKGSKGGVDCGMLLKAVFQACGLIPQGNLNIAMDYSLQVAQHKPDKTYFGIVERFTHEIPESEVKPGDVALFKLGHAYAHGGIVIEWPVIVHALAHGGVRLANADTHPKLHGVTRKIFTLNDDKES
jgi:cell wall-associated NlpC family hydrolase